MKVLLTVVGFLLSIKAFAQLEANHFIVTPEGRVNWQKVYENESVDFQDLVNTVKANTLFSDIQVLEDKITFLGIGIQTNPSALGYSRGGTSFYALGDIKAFFTIDYKPGRYRITAVNISSVVPVLNILMPSASSHEYTPIEESVGNGKGLKKGFIKKESLIMSHAIESQFQIVKQTDENW